jgi:indole-3-acetate monooxygenase
VRVPDRVTHAMRAAVDVVDVLFHAAGARSIYNDQGIERRFRDAHVAAQHFAGSPSHLSAGGRLVLGLPAGAPYW